MKPISVHQFLVVLFICFFGCWLEGSTAIAASENTTGFASTVAGSEITPNKYELSNLSRTEIDKVKKQVDKKASISEQENISHPDVIVNQLTYDMRAKQEEIRLYEVVLLAIMSLVALWIVLKCMSDSTVCNARDMLNGTGLVLVIFSTLMVIIIATVDAQLTAAMGVLGGIAGYLFGTLRSSRSQEGVMSEPGSRASMEGD